MRIVLVGGSGYVGKKLAERFVSAKHDVSNISRTGKGTATVPGFTYGHMQRLFEGADAVVNLAGANLGDKRWSFDRRVEIVSSRLDVTKQIAETIALCNSKPALISMSGTAFYGNTFVPSNEAMAHGNTFLAELCYEWEAAALAISKSTRVATVRLGVTLDPNDGALRKMLPFFKLGLGGALGRGVQYLPWIHPVDAIEAIAWITENTEAFGPYNVVSAQAITWNEFAHALGRTLNRPAVFRVPEILLRFAIGRQAEAIIYGQHVVPQRLLNDSFTFAHPTIDGALKNLLG